MELRVGGGYLEGECGSAPCEALRGGGAGRGGGRLGGGGGQTQGRAGMRMAERWEDDDNVQSDAGETRNPSRASACNEALVWTLERRKKCLAIPSLKKLPHSERRSSTPALPRGSVVRTAFPTHGFLSPRHNATPTTTGGHL